jgi:hypothetical protein
MTLIVREFAKLTAQTRAMASALVLATVGVFCAAHARDIDGDWAFFVGMSRRMFGTAGFAVYAENPNIQSGPLSLVAVNAVDQLHRGALAVVVLALGFLTVWCLFRAWPECAGRAVLLVGGAVLLAWWPYLKTAGHLDDALVLAVASLSVLLVMRDRRTAAAVLVGLALAIKPWAVFLLPITLHGVQWRSRQALTPLISVFVGGLLWSPFILGHAGTLDGLSPTVWLAPDAVLRLFGGSSGYLTSATRVAQLLLALSLATSAVLRDRTAGVLLVGVAARMMFDGGTWNYYTVGFLVGALMWDVSRAGRRVPWATLAATLLLPPAWLAPQLTELRSVLRLAACLGAIAVVSWPERVQLPASGSEAWGGRRPPSFPSSRSPWVSFPKPAD